MKFLVSLASTLLVGVATAAATTTVFPQSSSANPLTQTALLDQVSSEPTSEPSVQLHELNDQGVDPIATEIDTPHVVMDQQSLREFQPTTTLAAPTAPTAPTPTATTETEPVTPTATTEKIQPQQPLEQPQEAPLVSIDAPVVAGSEEQQQPVQVFVSVVKIRSVGGASVLEITPERQTLTLKPSESDRLTAWRNQLQNDLMQQPATTVGYRGVPAPPSGSTRFAVQPGAMQVAAANLDDRNYLETLFPAPTQPTYLPTDGSMIYPLSRVVPITSNFGWRRHPIYGSTRFHSGIDLGAAYGTPVLAVLPGQVVAVGDGGGYGLMIVLQHGSQYQTLYAHLSQAFVRVGDVVQPGQVIGAVGASGNVTGPHLHLELKQLTADGWQAIDFLAQLQAAATTLQTGGKLAPVAQPLTPDPDAPMLRVAVGKALKNAWLASSTPAWILDAQQRPIGILPGMQSVVAVPSSKGIKMGNSLYPTVFFVQPSNGGAVAVGGKWYRGKLMVVSLPKGLYVVNWVDVESYLYSVVGGESYPSWGQEALKAQAIAARTYALKIRNEEPASAWFDLDNTTRYQRYRGMETEFASTIQAVVATRAQILVDSKYGTLILSEYAATQDIVNSVHNGYGLSQWGAASLAKNGFQYSQILRHYYPGTSLAVIGSR